VIYNATTRASCVAVGRRRRRTFDARRAEATITRSEGEHHGGANAYVKTRVHTVLVSYVIGGYTTRQIRAVASSRALSAANV
jgi:hypothetical protein